MADAIEIYLDLSTPQGALVSGLNDRTPFTLGPFYQGSRVNLRVFPVVTTGSIVTPPYFTKVALTNMELEVVVGPRAGSTAILAAQYTWTKQTSADSEGKSGYFYATLNLDTSDMNTAVGTNDTLSRYIEFRLNRSSAGFGPVAQATITIISSVKDPSGSASIPTPTASYMTRDECLSLFVAWRNDLISANAGRNIVFSSPDALKTREIGVDNDGTGIDSIT